MFNFEYEIVLNEEGRPYINPIKNTAKEMSFVEHKFMALEMSRSIITSTIRLHESNPEKKPLPKGELERLKYLESEIIRIADIFLVTIKEQFELLNIAEKLLNKDKEND
jgi:hypothetical protein